MKSAQNKIIGAALLSLALPLTAQATGTLQNDYVLAGVSNYGTLGSNKTVSPGILFDPTGSSIYGINDFLTPGTPFEGFYITSSAGNYQSNNTGHGSNSFVGFTIDQISSTVVSASASSLDGALGVSNLYSLTTIGGRSAIEITTTLTNNTASVLTSLNFLRTLDPDPDVNAYSVYDTTNVTLSDDQACATGARTGQTICAFTAATYRHKAGVSASWATNPATYLAGTNSGNGDYTIGIGFDLGDLAAGDSLTLTYGYALGETLDIASGGSTGGGAIPEPSSPLLIATGLLGLAAIRRFKRKQR
ncbi:PEP-CTERM sorting domain-containing protein [Zoogloea sp. 1C4]|jgi:hypothetical protein|uniref:PEP-CTERM sorting domain-containing protein n=1 Tax=Zoogloea sp. 1C4 TaxID=2570190 RepID=UPI00129220BE|nr:PEP-CTERM sorting domain-containing protein [Zoogloea sp. 1C4]